MMANAYENYLRSVNVNKNVQDRLPGKYKEKLNYLKQLIREYVHENAALVDELEEVQTKIIIRQEERKFLLRKLCEYEPQVAAEVQNLAKAGFNQAACLDTKKGKKRPNADSDRKSKSRKNCRARKKIVQPVPLDNTGRPIFPIELGNLTIHCLGEVVSDRIEFHSEDVIYPVGFISTRSYGSLDDPTVKCIYSCKISEVNGLPRFEIEMDDNLSPIVGDTPDVCHSLLLQKINDALSLNVVSTRPRGNDFFGLSHPTVLNLLQSFPGSRKCVNYKWNKFEVSRSGDIYTEDNDAALSYEYLQRSINFCKYKMAPDILQKPSDEFIDHKDKLHEYLLNN
ncbi:transforming growth factor beta regulator 1 [Tribolium castaneum]|uniref:transforming growth factor beta regulator 1 n=1 Tax=Tribolium castaneum TaxID=7070 RepID=UPI0030FEC3B1